jgi:hypothetical protein
VLHPNPLVSLLSKKNYCQFHQRYQIKCIVVEYIGEQSSISGPYKLTIHFRNKRARNISLSPSAADMAFQCLKLTVREFTFPSSPGVV